MEVLARPQSNVRQWVSPSTACFSPPQCLSSREPDLGATLGGSPEVPGAHYGEPWGSLCVVVGVVMRLGFLDPLCFLAFMLSPMLTQPLLTRARRVPSTRWCERSSTTRCAH